MGDTAGMRGHLVSTNRTSHKPERATAQRLLREGELLWLDVESNEPDVMALLAEVFTLHPLALKHVVTRDQRPKLEEYDDFVHLIVYLAQAVDQPAVEVHCFYSEKFLITLHHGACAALTDLAEHLPKPKDTRVAARLVLLYQLLAVMTDSFLPVLSEFDDNIDNMHDAIIARPTSRQLTELSTMKRWLAGMRRVVLPMRDMLARITAGSVDIPAMDAEAERYFRDLYSHLIRIGDVIDGHRDLLTNCMDVYMSMQSNRMNMIMKQLTIAATVFLPLTFLTGFFGQNFSWLTEHLSGLVTFLVFGLGTEVVAVAALWLWFRGKRWL